MKENFKDKYLRYFILLGIIALVLVVFSALNPVFFRLGNLMNFIGQAAVLSVLSIGMTFVIISGGLDLSIGSSLALSGAVAGIVLKITNNALLGILAALLGGSLIGLLNGFLIGKTKISPFMATLATMTVARGLAISVTGAESIAVNNKALLWLGQASIGPLPVVFLLIMVMYIFGYYLLKRSVFGRNTYAIGGNTTAARIMGINITRNIILIYIFNGILVGLAALITIGRMSSIQPWSGQGLEFEVITAVILGGAILAGGEGTIIGTLLGAILVGIIANGLTLLNITNYYLNIIRGFILILAVIFDKYSFSYLENLEKKRFLKRQL